MEPTLAQVSAPGFNDPLTSTSNVQTQETVIDDGSSVAYAIITSGPWTALFGISTFISLMLAVGIVYSIIRMKQIRANEQSEYDAEPMSAVARRVFGIEDASHPGSANEVRWRDVLHHADSDNPNDWRLAILEADVMLDDAITQKGYHGEGLGEKMKQVDRSDINTIDDAWEAHKMRNRVAHE